MGEKLDIRILKILIVEDTPERLEILKNLYREHAWFNVNTAERAKKLVIHFKFDLISLDYDLAGEQKGDEVAKAISSGINHNTKIIIHSMNALGRKKIKEIVPDGIILPVSAMIKTNKRFKYLKSELRNGLEFDWSLYCSRFN